MFIAIGVVIPQAFPNRNNGVTFTKFWIRDPRIKEIRFSWIFEKRPGCLCIAAYTFFLNFADHM